jgi:D-apionolactonase
VTGPGSGAPMTAGEPAGQPGQLPSGSQILRGADRSPEDAVEVRAGDLSAEFAAGGLRYLRMGGIEVARRIAVAVRDQAWNTVPAALSDVRIHQTGDEFRITFVSRHEAGELCFVWKGIIGGTADGSCSFSMDGSAVTSFPYRRIGICVLHPPEEFAGQGFSATGGGAAISGQLPALVAPPGPSAGIDEPLIPAFARLALSGRHVFAEFSFTGDHFEIEDQRNWTDDSFKSYSRLPVVSSEPEHLAAGTRLQQAVSVSATMRGRAPRTRPPAVPPIVIGDEMAARMPEAGLAHADDVPPAARGTTGLLARMALAHLRADVHLQREGWAGRLDRARRQAQELGCPLEIAVFLENGAPAGAGQLAPVLTQVPVRRVLVYRADAESTPGADVAAVRAALAALPPGTPFGGGTDLNFAELNRSRPDVTAMDAIAFPINPQVHAADEDSMVETAEGVRAVVRTARSFAAGRPVLVSPISLRPRFNPDEPEVPDGSAATRPGNADPRQLSLFGACWALVTMKALAEEGVHATTWFETTGPRGVIDSDTARPASSLFPGHPGLVFPVYHLLRDVCEFGGAPLLACSGDPLRAAAIAVRREDGMAILVANLRPEPAAIEVVLPHRPRPGEVTIRRLNAVTAADAMLSPESFRGRAQAQSVRGRALRLDLLPYEYSRLDLGLGGEQDG